MGREELKAADPWSNWRGGTGGWSAEYIGIPATIVTASIAGTLAVVWLLRSPVIKARRMDQVEAASSVGQ